MTEREMNHITELCNKYGINKTEVRREYKLDNAIVKSYSEAISYINGRIHPYKIGEIQGKENHGI